VATNRRPLLPSANVPEADVTRAALSARTKSMAGRPGRRARKQRAGEALATLAFGHANRTIKVTVGRRGKAHNMA
jgi:hypothetical protein